MPLGNRMSLAPQKLWLGSSKQGTWLLLHGAVLGIVAGDVRESFYDFFKLIFIIYFYFTRYFIFRNLYVTFSVVSGC